MDRAFPSELDQKSSARVNSAGRDSDFQSPEAVAPMFGRYNSGFTTIASDVVAIVMPLASLGLVAGLYSIHGDRVDKVTLDQWRNGVIAFASIFPIAFAAIIGRLMYQMSRFRLERGTTIGVLEQLNGRRTFGGAVLTQISMGTLNILGISVILLWIFSPLGTQSVLRTLETRLEPVTTPTSVIFKDPALGTAIGDQTAVTPGSYHIGDFFENLKNKLSVLMTMPDHIQTDTMDVWGNVKIPFFGEGYDNTTMRTPRTDWQDVVWSPARETYTAMAGVPISTVPVGNTTLFIESGHIELNCYNISTFYPAVLEERVEFGWKSLYTGGEEAEAPRNANNSWQGYPMERDIENEYNPNWLIAVNRFVDQIWFNQTFLEEQRGLERGQHAYDPLGAAMESPRLFVNETDIKAGPTRLFFFGNFNFKGRAPPDGISAYCDVRQKYVENRINCERRDMALPQNCTVVAQRPSHKPHPPETISHLSFPRLWEKISDKLPFATQVSTTDIGLTFLANPSDMGDTSTFALGREVNKLEFSRRLSQILNTYILLGSRDYGANVNESVPWIGLANSTTSSELTTLVEVYEISTLWLALALVSCVIFFAGGIASIVYTHLSDGPEVLGYASTLVRDSKFMDLPPESSHMSAPDVSRMLKEHRVRYGYTEITRQGQPVLGVGPEAEVAPIKNHK